MFLIVAKYKIKVTILTVFKCAVLWREVDRSALLRHHHRDVCTLGQQLLQDGEPTCTELRFNVKLTLGIWSRWEQSVRIG